MGEAERGGNLDTHVRTFNFANLLTRERSALDQMEKEAGAGGLSDDVVKTYFTDQRHALDEAGKGLEKEDIRPMVNYLLNVVRKLVRDHFGPVGEGDEQLAREHREGGRAMVTARLAEVQALLLEEMPAEEEA